mgnify:CR=1 FL=1
MTITSPLLLLLLPVLLAIIGYLGIPRNRFRRARDISSLVLRSIIMTLLVLALSGVQIVQSSDQLSVVFLVDFSDSMGTQARLGALRYIEESLGDKAPEDLAGVIVFGGDAQIARTMSTTRELAPINVQPAQTGNTDYENAIRTALGLLPSDTARRIVILSDGQPSTGDAISAAQLAAANNVEISYVQFTRPPSPEVQVQNVDVPTVLNEDQEFNLVVTIASEETTLADVIVSSGGEPVYQQTLELQSGVNSYTLRLRSGTSGFRDFRVQVNPLGDDGFDNNNRLSAYSLVEAVPTVLVVDGGSDETRYIVPALEDAGLRVDVITPNQLPAQVGTLAEYDSVILVNVSALNIPAQRLETLATYVSDLGGGLVTVGGPTSYGPGWYFQTPLEDVLPVEMQIKDQQRLPQLTIAYVIDRSGSMSSVSDSGIQYIDLAKEAIIRSIDFLQPTDRAGVVSFDNDAYWIAEFQDVQNRDTLQRLIATLRASGGTSIVTGMRLVAESIVLEGSERKHIILLTDGGADQGNLVDLVGQLNEEAGVTTSIISIGGYEAPFLQAMADAGQGYYHNVPDVDDIPRIFTVEAVLATRTYIQENAFTPVLSAIHPMMQGIDATPPLYGYVTTTAKPAAQVILSGPDPYSDPLLVSWQYGLGRSVAFMSDATSRWGAEWVNWDGFPVFWSQVVRWTITERTNRNLETQVIMEDNQARIVVDARDNDGNFLNGLELQTSVVYSGDSSAQRVQLRQVAPGRYEGNFIPGDEGAYFLRIAPGDNASNIPADLTLSQTTGWVMSYSPEYAIREFDADLLESMATLTDGQNLAAVPNDVFLHNIETADSSQPIWHWLVLIALLLLPFDIGVRRLLVTKSDFGRLYRWIRGGERADDGAAERISSLKEARDRARASTQEDEMKNRMGDLLSRPSMPSRDAAPPSVNQPGIQPRFDQTSDSNIGAKLLKKRRNRED